MYEKLVDEFFIKVIDLCKEFGERFTDISEIQYIEELQKKSIEELLKDIFGAHILDCVGVKYTKTSSTPYGIKYDIEFIDKTTHKIINSKDEFVKTINEYNHNLHIKKEGPIIININEGGKTMGIYEKLVNEFFIKINKLCDKYKYINVEVDIINVKTEEILIDTFGNNILEYIAYVVIKYESVVDVEDVEYKIDFIDKITHEVIESKDEFVSVLNNYNFYIKAKDDKNKESEINDGAPVNKYLGTKRDIKFRVWDDEIKQMVYINRIDIGDGSCKPGIFSSKIYDYWNRVELMEYTGIQDKNGNEIYEGDIVRTEIDPSVIDIIPSNLYSDPLEGEVRYYFGEFRIFNENGRSCKLFYDLNSLLLLGNKYEGVKNDNKK